ncbi:MAG: HupE/UreJ family protein [Luteolibacter sp.]
MSGLFKWLFGIAVLFCSIGGLSAHTGFESSTEVRIFSNRMQIVVRTSYALAWRILGDQAPADSGEAARAVAKPLLEAAAPDLLDVTVAGMVMKPDTFKCQFELNKDVAFVLIYERPSQWPLVVKVRFLSLLGSLDSGTISVFDQSDGILSGDVEPVAGKVLFSNDPSLSVTLALKVTVAPVPAPAVEDKPTAAPAAPPLVEQPGFWKFFQLGIKHILTGYDHLLFLLALLIGCRRLRPMLLIITAFTLAHSITLALATFDIVNLPSRWVESFIALSIIYVGLENFSRNLSVKRRAGLTFLFGLVHGLGFAGLLKSIGLGAGGQSVLAPLLAFNLGVEAGQLAVVALVLPVLFYARRQPGFGRFGIPALSTIVVLLGCYWFVQRAFPTI